VALLAKEIAIRKSKVLVIDSDESNIGLHSRLGMPKPEDFMNYFGGKKLLFEKTKEMSGINLDVSVSYNDDLDHVMNVINRVGHELAEDPVWKEAIIKEPQALRVNNFGDSGIDIKITGDTQPMRQWEVTGQLRLRLKKAFDKEGIEIPWPHTKLYFGNAPPAPDYGKKAKD